MTNYDNVSTLNTSLALHNLIERIVMKRNDFTTNEVLPVIAIVMIGIALLLPKIVTYKDGLIKKAERQKNQKKHLLRIRRKS